MDVKDARAQFGDKMDQATGKKIFEGDSNPSIALAWTGDDGQTLLAVTTYESFVSFPRKILKKKYVRNNLIGRLFYKGCLILNDFCF